MGKKGKKEKKTRLKRFPTSYQLLTKSLGNVWYDLWTRSRKWWVGFYDDIPLVGKKIPGFLRVFVFLIFFLFILGVAIYQTYWFSVGVFVCMVGLFLYQWLVYYYNQSRCPLVYEHRKKISRAERKALTKAQKKKEKEAKPRKKIKIQIIPEKGNPKRK